MGGCASRHFSEEEITQLCSNVFFTPKEVNAIYRRYLKLGGTKEDPISMEVALSIPELQNNPFKLRIGKIFGEFDPTHASASSSLREPLSLMNRENLLLHSQNIAAYKCPFATFLNILSDFSPRTPFSAKAHVAFELYDFTEDGVITSIDVECLIELSTGSGSLQADQISKIASEVMEEADMDGSKQLTEPQFQRLLKRMPDFMDHFQFHVEGI